MSNRLYRLYSKKCAEQTVKKGLKEEVVVFLGMDDTTIVKKGAEVTDYVD